MTKNTAKTAVIPSKKPALKYKNFFTIFKFMWELEKMLRYRALLQAELS